jgi:hypothetical protein
MTFALKEVILFKTFILSSIALCRPGWSHHSLSPIYSAVAYALFSLEQGLSDFYRAYH